MCLALMLRRALVGAGQSVGRRSPSRKTDIVPFDDTTNTAEEGSSHEKRIAEVCLVPRYDGSSRRERSDDRRWTPILATRPPGSTSAARSNCDSAFSRAAKWDRRLSSSGGIATD